MDIWKQFVDALPRAVKDPVRGRIREWLLSEQRRNAGDLPVRLMRAAEAVYRAGRYDTDSPDMRKLEGAGNPEMQRYLRDHRRRLELTFQMLRSVEVPSKAKQLVDLGSWAPYVPVLREIFPSLQLVCAGEPGDVAAEKTIDGVRWFGLDLESERLPVDDDSSAVVLLLEVIEHFYQDPMFALAEANRILQPGGKLVITTPNLTSFRSLISVLNNYSPYTYGQYTPGYPPHVHEYVPRDLEVLLRAAGFSPKVWTDNVYSEAVPTELTDWLAAFGFPTENRGDTIFAVATKVSKPVERYPRVVYDGTPSGLLKRVFELREKVAAH